MSRKTRYLMVETSISIGVNVAMTLLMAYFVFGAASRVALAGPGGLMIDLSLQTFMVALMTVLMATLVTRLRRKSGLQIDDVAASAQSWPRHPLFRAAIAALAVTAILLPMIWLVLPMITPPVWGMPVVLFFKTAYAVALAAVLAPPALRIAMSEPL